MKVNIKEVQGSLDKAIQGSQRELRALESNKLEEIRMLLRQEEQQDRMLGTE